MVLDLRRAGGILTEGGVEIGGWRIESTHGHMSGEAELEDIKEKLGGVMRIPEIVFGQNTLQVQHLATGLTIRFNTVDALKSWTVAKRPPLQVRTRIGTTAYRIESVRSWTSLSNGRDHESVTSNGTVPNSCSTIGPSRAPTTAPTSQ